jgi:transposase
MLIPPGPVRVLVATKPVDFRKGMNGLAALVQEQLKADPFSGTIYCFRSKRADRVKLVFWDGKSAEQRRAVRREQSAPHCDALKRFLERQLGRVSAKAPIAQAIRYTLKHWEGLIRFLDDGRIDLDSNIVERSMRPQVLTRKNALFAGHDDGAQNWAIVASLIETSKLSRIDPYRYFADVLFHLVNLWPNGRLDELLPWNWAAAKNHLQRAA